MAKIQKKSSAKASSKAPAKTAAKGASKPSTKAQAKPKLKVAVKSAALNNSKAAKKPAAKAQAKPTLAKAVAGVVGKLFSKEKTDIKAKNASPLPAEIKIAKKDKGPKKKLKKGKEGKDSLDMEDDDLLASDEEIGSEEIPDLSEFDEHEEVEIVEEPTEEELRAAVEAKSPDDEIILTDAEGRRYCRVRDCDQISAVEGYCRYHYLLLWKKIQARRKILVDGKLGRYVEELTSRYPDKFLEMIRKDLRAEKDFLAAIAELEIDESANENEFEDEAQTFIDEVRGLTTDSGTMTEEDDF